MPRGENPNSRANLKVPSSKEARKNGKKGGKASAKTRAAMIDIRESLIEYSKEHPDRINRALERLVAMMEHGNLKAFEMYLKLVGQMPKEQVEVEVASGKLDEILSQIGGEGLEE